MKSIILTLLITTFAFSGFFKEDNAGAKAEYAENERLCKIFTEKVEKYKKTMRNDVLAEVTLASYEHRASLFCKKAAEAKKALEVE